jgi:4-diphosphocytidyl-2-C-methyl-D-erythritol kinase
MPAAFAKINLSLVVGPLRPDGKHEVVTVYQQVGLTDTVSLRRADGLAVTGYENETLVRRALEGLADAAGIEPRWRVHIAKAIPAAAGLGGGSSDAAEALRLANDELDHPLDSRALHELAASIGADVPFFLSPSTSQLGTGDGTELVPLDLPTDYNIVLLLPTGVAKVSTAAVYDEFDRRAGAAGFEERSRSLLDALRSVRLARDLAPLPANDLVSSPHAASLIELGAFRADVTGAGPALYGLFEDENAAAEAANALADIGRTWLVRPV